MKENQYQRTLKILTANGINHFTVFFQTGNVAESNIRDLVTH